jgi:hypothetical protein
VRRARAHFHVVRLQQRTAMVGPIGLQLQNDLLKCEHVPILQGRNRQRAPTRRA